MTSDGSLGLSHRQPSLVAAERGRRRTTSHALGGPARRGEIARNAMLFGHLSAHVRPVLVNGVAGVVVAPHGRPFTVMAFAVVDGRIAAIDRVSDPARPAKLDLSGL